LNVVSLGEMSSELDEDQRMDVDLLMLIDDCIHMLHQQQRRLNAAVAVLVVFQTVARARSRSPIVPGVLLASASAAAVPGFRTFMRLSTLMLRFHLAYHRLRLQRSPRDRLGGAAVQEPREVPRPDSGLPPLF
jgi:hypothetical protein